MLHYFLNQLKVHTILHPPSGNCGSTSASMKRQDMGLTVDRSIEGGIADSGIQLLCWWVQLRSVLLPDSLLELTALLPMGWCGFGSSRWLAFCWPFLEEGSVCKQEECKSSSLPLSCLTPLHLAIICQLMLWFSLCVSSMEEEKDATAWGWN